MYPYPDTYALKHNEQLSVQRERNVTYEHGVKYIVVSSLDRDISAYPNVNKYSISLPDEIKNVYSIELIRSTIANVNNVTLQPYLILKIDEVEGDIVSLNNTVSQGFAIIDTGSDPTTYITRALDDSPMRKVFKTPKASLSRISVSLFTSSGVLFNFTGEYHNTFVFKIVYEEVDRSKLKFRNLFA